MPEVGRRMSSRRWRAARPTSTAATRATSRSAGRAGRAEYMAARYSGACRSSVGRPAIWKACAERRIHRGPVGNFWPPRAESLPACLRLLFLSGEGTGLAGDLGRMFVALVEIRDRLVGDLAPVLVLGQIVEHRFFGDWRARAASGRRAPDRAGPWRRNWRSCSGIG